MSQKKIRIILLTILLTLSVFFFLDRTFLRGVSISASQNKTFKILGTVIRLIRNDYVEEPNPQKTMDGAFKGIADSLDVLSSYLDKENLIKYNQRKDKDLKDIGIILYKRYGSFPMVIGIKENSPAENEGVKLGELISTIDGQPTLMMSMLEANLYLKDKESHPIRIEIVRANKNEVLTIRRTQVHVKPFDFNEAKNTSGILKIHNFYSSLTTELKKHVIPQLIKQTAPLILDLRDCHEGDIEEAQRFVNYFLKKEKIGYFEKKGKFKEFLSCLEPADIPTLPLIIWINQATIGPAEVVSAVLKKHRNATVIGSQTLGLVAKQQFFTLDDETGLVLTSAVFHLSPEEKSWQKGLVPDIKLKKEDQSSSDFLKKTYEILRKK